MRREKASSRAVLSIVLAAGRGSRMTDFEGNKTLLPLVPVTSLYEGSHPILMEVLENLPQGPKAVVVHFRKKDVMDATRGMGVIYCEQEELNGTGGALLAAGEVIAAENCERVIVTMGDVPFVKVGTYDSLLRALDDHSLVVLGFRPESKRQYGLIETKSNQVRRIIEWKYWRHYPQGRQDELEICNSGIYALRREALLHYLPVLADNPHNVEKSIEGRTREFKEYFITDLVEFMAEEGLSVGCVVAEDEREVMGIDDPSALIRAQEFFRREHASPGGSEDD